MTHYQGRTVPERFSKNGFELLMPPYPALCQAPRPFLYLYTPEERPTNDYLLPPRAFSPLWIPHAPLLLMQQG